MDQQAVEWLVSPQGQRALAVATAAVTEHPHDPIARAALVRGAERDPALATAALTQAVCRAKAVAKFGADAAAMYFVPEALEQATRQSVATHRAARLALAEVSSVIDLGCGIGGDLIAMARAGLIVAGVDLDPVRVAVAKANLDALELSGAVQMADATTLDVSAFGAAYVDPARRGARGRTFRTDDWTPSWEFVLTLLGGSAVAKVAPGIAHDLIPDGVEAEWVSDRGDLKEASLWSPRLATVTRRATVIGDGGLATLTEDDDPYIGQERPVRPVGTYLYEPDDAVMRAGLVTAVAAGVGGGLLDPKIAWVTSDASFHTPFAQGYRVIEQLPYREKQLKAALVARDVGALTIKKRGVDVVPEQLRKRLSLKGSTPATIVLTRVADAGAAFLVEPF